MPTNPFTPQTGIREIVEDAVRNDTALQRRVRIMVNNAVAHAEWTLKHGSPQEKTVIMRQVVLPMIKALGDVDEDKHKREQQEVYQRIRDDLRSA
jgi:hypothetical protein